MIRTIDGFHLDEHGDWVAELSCLHNQHVRHRPPFWDRPWVTHASGREERIGSEIDCPLCDRAELPPGLDIARTAGPFDAASVPAAASADPPCLRSHPGPPPGAQRIGDLHDGDEPAGAKTAGCRRHPADPARHPSCSPRGRTGPVRRRLPRQPEQAPTSNHRRRAGFGPLRPSRPWHRRPRLGAPLASVSMVRSAQGSADLPARIGSPTRSAVRRACGARAPPGAPRRRAGRCLFKCSG